MKTVRISEEALAVLSEMEIWDSPKLGTAANITDGQLDRKLYVEVNRVLEEIGGKWNKGAKVHVFADKNVEEVRGRLDEVILSGDIAPLRKNGFFATPATVAVEMFDLLNWKPEHFILEPNCGDGALAGTFFDVFPNSALPERWVGIEINKELAAKARLRLPKGMPVFNADFLSDEWLQHFSERQEFDRVLMNPPFENRAEAAHVIRAFGLLSPGGRLVSVMSAGVKYRREREYQAVRDLATFIEELPAGSFKESGTMVSTCIVVIDNPAILQRAWV